jgi:topoisomerase-4 subunit B
MYALDEGELHAILDKCAKDGVARERCQISRFKGLGEMSAEQLWETTLNPDTRRLMPVHLGGMDFAQTEALMTQLMGKGEAAARRELMERHGDAVEIDI